MKELFCTGKKAALEKWEIRCAHFVKTEEFNRKIRERREKGNGKPPLNPEPEGKHESR